MFLEPLPQVAAIGVCGCSACCEWGQNTTTGSAPAATTASRNSDSFGGSATEDRDSNGTAAAGFVDAGMAGGSGSHSTASAGSRGAGSDRRDGSCSGRALTGMTGTLSPGLFLESLSPHCNAALPSLGHFGRFSRKGQSAGQQQANLRTWRRLRVQQLRPKYLADG